MDDLISYFLANKLFGDRLIDILHQQVIFTIVGNIVWLLIIIALFFVVFYLYTKLKVSDKETACVMLGLLYFIFGITFIVLFVNVVGMILNPDFYVIQFLLGG